MDLTNKRVAVLGLGASGEAAAKLLHRKGALVSVFDSNPVPSAKVSAMRDLNISVGTEAAVYSDHYDLAVVSPGINPQSPLVRLFKNITHCGELELAFRFCSRPIIAITGTNGKTTTTELVTRMLNTAGIRSLACGNIGLPLSEALNRQDEIDIFTVEVSSFQLETVFTFKPAIALWLNFAADHLDRYPTLDAYYHAKLRIFANQNASDWAIVNRRERLPSLAAQTLTFNAYDNDAEFSFDSGEICFRGTPVLDIAETQLHGIHNIENLMAALGVAFVLRIPWEKAAIGLKGYRLLPHRCETVGNIDGVTYINDSKATNIDSLRKALESQTAPVILIAGGKDKGFDFDSLIELIAAKVKQAVLIGEMGNRIRDSWSRAVPCVLASTLLESVQIARRAAHCGEVVLFSPGTSSFDMFRDYSDRGDQFREIVQELSR
ncbi:MAG: UDP-N-acetylmuramoyl-L-alanine--D-glutamate ligase [Verrucomicrobia bacterium]|nr:UDP-N-acetylmuramoyl-L-alanine--D-glutamate ligase [Verrucomicrobiota bacterium]